MKTYLERGFSFAEMIIVLLVLGIITGMTMRYAPEAAKKQRIKSTISYIQMLGSDIDEAYEDYGPYTIDTDLSAEQQRTKCVAYCRKLASNYLSTDLDISSIDIKSNGFYIKTLETDQWSQPYYLYFRTDDGHEGDCMIISAGPNMVLDNSNYSSGSFEDDIALILVFRR